MQLKPEFENKFINDYVDMLTKKDANGDYNPVELKTATFNKILYSRGLIN
jgi:hypothetical protein